MAAGLGFKTFTTGEVLTAADTNGYLMQGVLVFASSAARASAITSPQEGQYSYLKDTNSTEYYDGAAWIAAPIGDITGVTAGTGISGGGTSGTVTVTNSMATEITAAGDIIVGTGSGTFDNLPIGTTGQILTADTTVSPYKVKWATPAGGGKVLQVVQGTTTTGVTTTSTSYVDTGVTATITPSAASSKVLVFISQQLLLQGTGAGGAFCGVGLKALRGATTIIDASSSNSGAHSIEAGFSGNSRVGLRGYEALNYLDSPATTSATIYKVQMAVATSGDTLISQGNVCQSSIILMEIGA